MIEEIIGKETYDKTGYPEPGRKRRQSEAVGEGGIEIEWMGSGEKDNR